MYTIIPNDYILLELLFEPIIHDIFSVIVFMSSDKLLTKRLLDCVNDLTDEKILSGMLCSKLLKLDGVYFQIKEYHHDTLEENLI